jgi:hypothetical protein
MHHGLFWDVREEFRELNEKLHPERHARESGRSPDPRVTLERITNWTRAELAELHPLAERVRRYARGPERGTVVILLLNRV